MKASDEFKKRLTSRKFIQSSFILIGSTVLKALDMIDDNTWLGAIAASQAIYAAGNVREKENRKGG